MSLFKDNDFLYKDAFTLAEKKVLIHLHTS